MFSRLVSKLTLTVALVAISASTATLWSQEKKKESAADAFKVPEGEDISALVKFIERLENFRPNSAADQLAHRQHFRPSLRKAAARIQELEKDKKADSLKIAKRAELTAGLQDFFRAPPNRQADFVAEVKELVESIKEPSIPELRLSNTVMQILEQSDNKALAGVAYEQLGTIFAKSKDETAKTYGERWLGSARRMNLVGNEVELEGTTVDGKAFDWKAYRGKVVLVDFWATWCGPCIREIPNVSKNYEKYHKRGFDVVGISLDNDRQALEGFLAEKKLPWVTLYADGADGQHPMATYYGISAIPTVFLVDKTGKVVSLNARGPELGRLLEELLGEEDAAGSGAE